VQIISALKDHYGAYHQRVASALNNLSHVFIQKGRLEEALTMQIEALQILLDTYGENHEHVATVYQVMTIQLHFVLCVLVHDFILNDFEYCVSAPPTIPDVIALLTCCVLRILAGCTRSRVNTKRRP
jgi:hypothetical protein